MTPSTIRPATGDNWGQRAGRTQHGTRYNLDPGRNYRTPDTATRPASWGCNELAGRQHKADSLARPIGLPFRGCPDEPAKSFNINSLHRPSRIPRSSLACISSKIRGRDSRKGRAVPRCDTPADNPLVALRERRLAPVRLRGLSARGHRPVPGGA